jgi:LemA protein
VNQRGAAQWILLGIFVLLVIVLVSWYVSGLNRVVTLDESVDGAWAQVETQLQRRYDLIPNLVNTVKGFATQEREVFTTVTELRSRWAQAGTRQEQIDAARGIEGAISRLLLVAENYPQLKSSENFLTLQSQLEGTENRIAVERMRYNETARAFNTYIRTVFGSFFAQRRGLTEPAPYFEAVQGAEEVPSVDFE